jgi:hypothetical protein
MGLISSTGEVQRVRFERVDAEPAPADPHDTPADQDLAGRPAETVTAAR